MGGCLFPGQEGACKLRPGSDSPPPATSLRAETSVEIRNNWLLCHTSFSSNQRCCKAAAHPSRTLNFRAWRREYAGSTFPWRPGDDVALPVLDWPLPAQEFSINSSPSPCKTVVPRIPRSGAMISKPVSMHHAGMPLECARTVAPSQTLRQSCHHSLVSLLS